MQKRAVEVVKRLEHAMPRPVCELDHQDAWQLLVATILSAQSTDKMVNRVTPALFARFPSPASLGMAAQEEVEALIKPTGFFRVKSKNIREASRLIAEKFGGAVPKNMDDMLALPGVARKTANVVLGTGYGVASGMAVDTHAARVSQRLSLTAHKDPVRIEQDLLSLIPAVKWVDSGHRLVLHGRYVCTARAPACGACPLNEICPSAMQPPKGTWKGRAQREGLIVESRGELLKKEAEASVQEPKASDTARARSLGRRK